MPATRADLMAKLAELGIRTTTHEHPPVFTVAEAKAHCGHLPGGHCKSLFLKDKRGQLWLLVARDDAAVNLKALARRLGVGTLSFGRPELLQEVLGVAPGAVTPFGLINDAAGRAKVLLDRAMLEAEILNYHPLRNDATTAIRGQDLQLFIVATGHAAEVIDLDA
ncbi:MAG: prolyl-tRNA synthetase associated domain-containing protein [Alphaproteobacteria bacterium]|nr:prolyl-tRNA synthetase associated domain-containing protein [Alphaproteobacteria bacterium]